MANIRAASSEIEPGIPTTQSICSVNASVGVARVEDRDFDRAAHGTKRLLENTRRDQSGATIRPGEVQSVFSVARNVGWVSAQRTRPGLTNNATAAVAAKVNGDDHPFAR